MSKITSLRSGTPARLVVNGQDAGYVSDWQFEVTTEQVDGADMWGKRYFPGRQEATISLSGLSMGAALQALPAAREDIVTHLGTRCCCRHCPDGGDHG